MRKRVAVIGGGPAGLMASARAGERGLKAVLFEKNDCLGKKLLISGKGRCNITNSTDMDGLIKNIPGNGNFLYSAFYSFSNYDLIDFLHSRGLKTKTERGGRVFPESDKSEDVLKLMEAFVLENNVEILLKSPAEEIIAEAGKVKAVRLKNGKLFECDSVVLATGGASYPGTGSTGEGFRMASKLGHRIVDLKPSLVPLIASETWVKELQGLSLKNISIEVIDEKGKRIYDDFGEMLFTHFGVSGPVILSCSRHIMKYGYKNVKILIDLKPALSEKKLDERIKRDFSKFSRKQFRNSLGELLPGKLIPVVISLSCIPPDKPVNQITKDERHNLVKVLKRMEINISGARPLSEAIVTAGGIATNEINPSTMESKLVNGLFFAGEIIDVDGYTGGFNLTIAFSTGYLAGMSC